MVLEGSEFDSGDDARWVAASGCWGVEHGTLGHKCRMSKSAWSPPLARRPKQRQPSPLCCGLASGGTAGGVLDSPMLPSFIARIRFR